MKKVNGCKLALCMLTLGVALGYFLTRLLDKLDCHFVSFGHGGDGPMFFRTNTAHPCNDDDTTDDAVEDHDCGEDTNEPEPYTEPLNGSAMDYEEP